MFFCIISVKKVCICRLIRNSFGIMLSCYNLIPCVKPPLVSKGWIHYGKLPSTCWLPWGNWFWILLIVSSRLTTSSQKGCSWFFFNSLWTSFHMCGCQIQLYMWHDRLTFFQDFHWSHWLRCLLGIDNVISFSNKSFLKYI